MKKIKIIVTVFLLIFLSQFAVAVQEENFSVDKYDWEPYIENKSLTSQEKDEQITIANEKCDNSNKLCQEEFLDLYNDCENKLSKKFQGDDGCQQLLGSVYENCQIDLKPKVEEMNTKLCGIYNEKIKRCDIRAGECKGFVTNGFSSIKADDNKPTTGKAEDHTKGKKEAGCLSGIIVPLIAGLGIIIALKL